MIHYTDALTALIADITARVEPLAFIDMRKLLVFGRVGRAGTAGAYATCHSLNLPTSEPGYYFWRDRDTGSLTRRSEWFVIKTPEVRIGPQRLDYLLSFSIPRFCNQSLVGARKAARYPGCEPWVAKLDTVMHELYHIAPNETGLRKFERADGLGSWSCHGETFLEDVAAFARVYLESGPDETLLEFLEYDFSGLVRRYGEVVGTVFRNFPSYPQRYPEALWPQPEGPDAGLVQPVVATSQPRLYTELDLDVRRFSERGARRLEAEPTLPTAA